MCGVSSLGMDHMSILGDTLDKIAWNKAGIFKVGFLIISNALSPCTKQLQIIGIVCHYIITRQITHTHITFQ